MSIRIQFTDLWTYNITVPPKERKSTENKLSIRYLNKKECTHIHGDLQIIVHDRVVPRIGMDSPSDVCFGYWIEMLVKLFDTLNTGVETYTIEGAEQGKPAYKFEKDGENIYLSIVDSLLGGKRDPNWQKVEFKYKDFKAAFKEFKKKLLGEISIYAPNMLEEWCKKFLTKS